MLFWFVFFFFFFFLCCRWKLWVCTGAVPCSSAAGEPSGDTRRPGVLWSSSLFSAHRLWRRYASEIWLESRTLINSIKQMDGADLTFVLMCLRSGCRSCLIWWSRSSVLRLNGCSLISSIKNNCRDEINHFNCHHLGVSSDSSVQHGQ